MIAKPYVHITKGGFVANLDIIFCRAGEQIIGDKDDCWLPYVYDLRIVLTLQAVAALGAIFLWVAWNALATTYGG